MFTKIFLNRVRSWQEESTLVGLGCLEVTCSPRDLRFADSSPAEVDGFFQDVKILSTSPPRGNLSWGSLKNLKPEKIDL